MDAPTDLDPTELPWRCAGAAGGYAWWYIDLASEEYALSVILFAGAVFSPHYAARVRRGTGDSGLAFPAVHISLSRLDPAGARQIAWVMNEHLPDTLHRTGDGLRLGGSTLSRRADGSISVEIQEDTTRFYGLAGQRLAGNIFLRPAAMPLEPLSPLRLCSEEASGPAHFWHPLCLRAHAEVDLRLGAQPLRFGGLAYHDSNFGAGRLEDAFACWSWAHGVTKDEAVALYRVLDRGGQGNSGRGILVHLREVGGRAQVERFGLSPTEEQPAAESRLLMLSGPRRFQVGPWSCDAVAGGGLLSAPFYARYHATLHDGERPALPGMAEFLDLRRFRSPAIQFLLRYKTRRVGVPRSWLSLP